MTEPSKTKAVPTPRTNAIHDLIERGKFIEAIRQVTELETALSEVRSTLEAADITVVHGDEAGAAKALAALRDEWHRKFSDSQSDLALLRDHRASNLRDLRRVEEELRKERTYAEKHAAMVREACGALLHIAELSSPRATSIQRQIHTKATDCLGRLVELEAEAKSVPEIVTVSPAVAQKETDPAPGSGSPLKSAIGASGGGREDGDSPAAETENEKFPT